MLPVVAGKRETKKQMLLYTVLLVPVSLVPWWIGTASWVWGALSAALGLAFLAFAVRVWFDETDRAPKQMFAYSILYLFLLFSGLIADSLIGRMV